MVCDMKIKMVHIDLLSQVFMSVPHNVWRLPVEVT